MRESNRVGCFVLTFALCLFHAASAQTKTPAASQATVAQVPFVGCKSDGQLGPMDAPTGTTREFPIAPNLAQQLACYQAQNGPGVLAPRGWNCFSTYGSSGSNLFVTPQPINSDILFANNSKGFDGPAVQLSISYGDTSGRFEVAGIIARVFPAYKAFVTPIIAEGIAPASDFPFAPYSKDKLTYKGNKIVEYETPPDSDGLGTRSKLRKNSTPISGVAILEGPETNLIHLSSRLPPNLSSVTSVIVQQVERDATQPDR